jgi:serine/threonine-protein kinase
MRADQDGIGIDPWLELVKLVAAGSMGEVWRGYHRGLDLPVAVKLLAQDFVSQDDVRERFRREARAAAKIESPHVVRYLDYGETADGRPFIVMEWLTGVTLQQLLDEQGPLAPRKVAFIVEQLARALAAVHAAGVVHRDVKPDNVLLVPSSSRLLIKLVDFSVSTCIATRTRLTQPGTLIGTPAYMSREQVLHGSADWRSDLWSLGVVAYELMTGELPFYGETIGAMCAAIVEGRCALPSAVMPELGSAMDSWFEKATAPKPHDRFDSATELAEGFVAAIRSSFGEDALRPSGELDSPASARSPEPPAADDVITTLSPAVRDTERAARRSWSRWLTLGAALALGGAGYYFYAIDPSPVAPLLPAHASVGLASAAEAPLLWQLAESRIDAARWRERALFYEGACSSAPDAKPAEEEDEPSQKKIARRPAVSTPRAATPRAGSRPAAEIPPNDAIVIEPDPPQDRGPELEP